MLNQKKINATLNRFPLCGHALIAQRGMAMEYCAMGAIAKSLGVSDEQLNMFPSDGRSLFTMLAPRLNSEYGIETYEQFSNLMRTNDSAKNSATRNNEVKNTVTMMAVDEIVKMVEESKLLSTESNEPSRGARR